MAENVGQAEAAVQDPNVNEDEQGNVDPVPEQVLPGQVPPYVLSQDNIPDTLFDAITLFAINESGLYGPLGAVPLMHFLKQKLDPRRTRKILKLVKEYTQQTARFTDQITRLLARVKQINEREKQQTYLLEERIKALIEGLSTNHQVPPVMELPSSNVTNKAMDMVALQGPLNKPMLISLISHGNNMEIPNVENVKKQLLNFLDTICNINSLNHIHCSEIQKRLTHAITYLGKEILE